MITQNNEKQINPIDRLQDIFKVFSELGNDKKQLDISVGHITKKTKRKTIFNICLSNHLINPFVEIDKKGINIAGNVRSLTPVKEKNNKEMIERYICWIKWDNISNINIYQIITQEYTNKISVTFHNDINDLDYSLKFKFDINNYVI